MLKRVASLAERKHALDRDFCAWLSAALEGKSDHQLRSGLVEVRVAASLLDATTDFRILDIPGRSALGKTTDFAIGAVSSIECKRLSGSAKTGGERVVDADAQHASTKAVIGETAIGLTILCLGRIDDLDTVEVDYLEDVIAEVDHVLPDLENTAAVAIAVESWRHAGEAYVDEFSFALLLAPGRSIEQSVPEALRGWFDAPIKRLR
jgi:hypothetical protein